MGDAECLFSFSFYTCIQSGGLTCSSWRMEEPGSPGEALSYIISVGPDGTASPPGSWLQGDRRGTTHQHGWQSEKGLRRPKVTSSR